MRRILGLLTIAILVSGCAATSPSPSAAPEETPAPTVAESASQAPALLLVALGDSLAASRGCECPRFPADYGELAAAALGQPVTVQNMAIVATTTADLLASLATPRVADPVTEAAIVTVSIGINDLGPCGTTIDAGCYGDAIAGVATNLEAIFSQIDTLKGDDPYILRGTAYDNFHIGSPSADSLGAAFLAFYAEQLDVLNATICAAVTAHGGICVELLTAFNGPGGDQPATALLVTDHVHPNREGHATIASELNAAGYAPLAP